MNVTRTRSVGFQAFFLSASTALAQVLVAVMYALCARELTPVAFGIIVSALAAANVLAGLLDFGTNSYWLRQLSRQEMTRPQLSASFHSKTLASLMACCIWCIILLEFGHLHSYWIAGPVAFAIVINQASQVPLRAAAKGELIALTIIVDRAVALTVLGAINLAREDWPNYLWVALTCGALTSASASLLMAPKEFRPLWTLHRLNNPWRGATYFGRASVASSAQSLDVPILSLAGGASATGLYGAVSRWTQPMGLLASAYASVSAPFIARSPTARDAWHHMKRGVWLPALAIAGSVGVVFLAPTIITLLIGSQYAGSAIVLQILAAGTILAIINQPLSILLQGLGNDKFVSRVTLSGLVLQLLLVAVLGWRFGAIGAGIAFCVLQVWVVAWLGHRTWKVRNDNYQESLLGSH